MIGDDLRNDACANRSAPLANGKAHSWLGDRVFEFYCYLDTISRHHHFHQISVIGRDGVNGSSDIGGANKELRLVAREETRLGKLLGEEEDSPKK